MAQDHLAFQLALAHICLVAVVEKLVEVDATVRELPEGTLLLELELSLCHVTRLWRGEGGGKRVRRSGKGASVAWLCARLGQSGLLAERRPR